MIFGMNQARHADERGAILLALRDDYGSKMTSVVSLARALFMIGKSATGDGLQWHLSLLADLGYIKIWRAEDMPGFRPDRQMDTRADKIVWARLTPKGLMLIDGAIAADPAVTF